MSEIKRYNIQFGYVEECGNGKFVHFSDFDFAVKARDGLFSQITTSLTEDKQSIEHERTTAQTSLTSALAERDKWKLMAELHIGERDAIREQIAEITTQRDEARKERARYRADFETTAAKADTFYKDRDTALSQVATLTQQCNDQQKAFETVLHSVRQSANDHQRNSLQKDVEIVALKQQLTEACTALERISWNSGDPREIATEALLPTPQPPVCKHCGKVEWMHQTLTSRGRRLCHGLSKKDRVIPVFTPAAPEPVSTKGGDEPCATHEQQLSSSSNAAPDDVRPVEGERQTPITDEAVARIEKKHTHVAKNVVTHYKAAFIELGFEMADMELKSHAPMAYETFVLMQKAVEAQCEATTTANARITELEKDVVAKSIIVGSWSNQCAELESQRHAALSQNAAMRGALGMARDSYELARLTKNNPTYSAIVAALSPSAGNQFVRREVLEELVAAIKEWKYTPEIAFTLRCTAALIRAESTLKTGGQEG